MVSLQATHAETLVPRNRPTRRGHETAPATAVCIFRQCLPSSMCGICLGGPEAVVRVAHPNSSFCVAYKAGAARRLRVPGLTTAWLLLHHWPRVVSGWHAPIGRMREALSHQRD